MGSQEIRCQFLEGCRRTIQNAIENNLDYTVVCQMGAPRLYYRGMSNRDKSVIDLVSGIGGISFDIIERYVPNNGGLFNYLVSWWNPRFELYTLQKVWDLESLLFLRDSSRSISSGKDYEKWRSRLMVDPYYERYVPRF